MAEEIKEKPKTLAELYPDFEQKYQELNQAYTNLWEALKTGQGLSEAKSKASQMEQWAESVISSFTSVDNLKEKVNKDTETFSLGLRLAKDELLLKQLFLTMEQLKSIL